MRGTYKIYIQLPPSLDILVSKIWKSFECSSNIAHFCSLLLNMYILQSIIIICIHTWQTLIKINKNMFFLSCKMFFLCVGTGNCLVINYNYTKGILCVKKVSFYSQWIDFAISHCLSQFSQSCHKNTWLD